MPSLSATRLGATSPLTHLKLQDAMAQALCRTGRGWWGPGRCCSRRHCHAPQWRRQVIHWHWMRPVSLRKLCRKRPLVLLEWTAWPRGVAADSRQYLHRTNHLGKLSNIQDAADTALNTLWQEGALTPRCATSMPYQPSPASGTWPVILDNAHYDAEYDADPCANVSRPRRAFGMQERVIILAGAGSNAAARR
jgi:hypothetical protein